MKKITYVLCASVLFLASCSSDNNSPKPQPGPYASGIFAYGTSSDGLAFFDPNKNSGTFYEDNIYLEANPEEANIGNGGINDVYIYGGKIYLLFPGNYSGDTEGSIVVCDAETMEKTDIITADDFDRDVIGDAYNLMVVNENKFYIGTNIYDFSTDANESGIRMLTLDLEGNATLSGHIAGTAGDLGVDGPKWSRMLKHNGYVLAGCGSKIKFINTATDQVDETKTMEVDPERQILDILEGRDGNVYAVVAGKLPVFSSYPEPEDYTTTASVIKINFSDYTYSEAVLLAGGDPVVIKGALESGACASLTSDELFLMEYTSWGSTGAEIYAYNYTTGETSVFANITFDSGRRFGKYMAADKKGRLYVPAVSYSDMEPMIFNIQTGARESSVEAKFTSPVAGDGGFAPTYIFREN